MKRFFLFFPVILFISCLSDDITEFIQEEEPIDYTAENEEEILAYIAYNELNAIQSTTGLHYVIIDEGTGDRPSASSNVTVAYKGYYTNGSVFDESDEDGIAFGLDEVITGWTEGITYFNEGGTGILLIPSHLGYGSFDFAVIPGGSVLIFDISLISIN